MASAEENLSVTEHSETSSEHPLLEDAAEDISNKDYQEAYDKISEEVDEETADVRKDSYRDEGIVANKADREVAELLSQIVTEEPYTEKDLENTKESLERLTEKYRE